MGAWEHYKKCEVRIEEKVRFFACHQRALAPSARSQPPCAIYQQQVLTCLWEKTFAAARSRPQGRGDCAGYYMDYFKCIDKCASKMLFKTLE